MSKLKIVYSVCALNCCLGFIHSLEGQEVRSRGSQFSGAPVYPGVAVTGGISGSEVSQGHYHYPDYTGLNSYPTNRIQAPISTAPTAVAMPGPGFGFDPSTYNQRPVGWPFIGVPVADSPRIFTQGPEGGYVARNQETGAAFYYNPNNGDSSKIFMQGPGGAYAVRNPETGVTLYYNPNNDMRAIGYRASGSPTVYYVQNLDGTITALSYNWATGESNILGPSYTPSSYSTGWSAAQWPNSEGIPYPVNGIVVGL